MKFSITFMTLFFCCSTLAEFQTAFQVFRTNYYPEKTVNYTVKIDPSCRFSNNPQFDIHFISTKNGNRLKGFSNFNKQYFKQRKVKVKGSDLTFTFKALDELSSKMGRPLLMSVRSKKKNGKCQLTSKIESRGSSLFNRLKTIEVEFVLSSLGHPKDFRWVGLVSSSQEVCLFGPCP